MIFTPLCTYAYIDTKLLCYSNVLLIIFIAMLTGHSTLSFINFNELVWMFIPLKWRISEFRTEMEVMSDKYWQCNTDYELLFTEHSQLEQTMKCS